MNRLANSLAGVSILSLFMMLSPVSYGKTSTKTSKGSSGSAAGSRKAASDGGRKYNCRIETNSNSGQKIDNILLDGEATFAGTDAHQAVTLVTRQDEASLTVENFLADRDHPYIIDSVICSRSLSCRGSRTTYRTNHGKLGTTTKAFQGSATGYGTTMSLGSEPQFTFNVNSSGFSVENIQMPRQNQRAIGVRATCATL